MNLYAVKSGDMYLKNSDDSVALVGMEKASVYPSQEAAQTLHDKAIDSGIVDVRIVVLMITETEL